MEQVDILLATYNGDKYLEEQLNSIINQTYKNWHLIIRDDGSKDSTLSIIDKYMKQYSDKITLIQDEYKNVGVNRNFSILMKNSLSEYSMFCDQDDHWLPEKIEVTINKMLEEEIKYSHPIPVLIFTNLKVADENLNITSDSFWDNMLLNPDNVFNINNLVVRNPVTGCTSMINKNLRLLINEIPKEALVHDWWISLTACLFGKINYVKKPTILYRQHSNNVLGASKNKRIKSLLLNPFKILNQMRNKQKLFQIQAKKLIDSYGDTIEPHKKNIIETYSKLYEYNYLTRKIKILKHKFWADNWMHNLLMIIF